MSPDGLKTLPKGNFILALPLFLKWGIVLKSNMKLKNDQPVRLPMLTDLSWSRKSSSVAMPMKMGFDEVLKSPIYATTGLLTFIYGHEVYLNICAIWLQKQVQKYKPTVLGMDNFRYTLLARALHNVDLIPIKTEQTI